MGLLQRRDYLLRITRFYLDTLTSHPVYRKANRSGMLRMPLHEDGDWHHEPITHIAPLWTGQQRHAMYLAFHLTRDGFNGCHIVFPIVGKGEDRLRITLHAHNTEEDVRRLVGSICSWAQEMMDIQSSGDRKRLPSAARLAYDLLERKNAAINGESETVHPKVSNNIVSGSNGGFHDTKPGVKATTANDTNGLVYRPSVRV
jgi:8-amino-7-oxononanoate synthase